VMVPGSIEIGLITESSNLERKAHGPFDSFVAAWGANPDHHFDCVIRPSLTQIGEFVSGGVKVALLIAV
jgi:hypothetical protein